MKILPFFSSSSSRKGCFIILPVDIVCRVSLNSEDGKSDIKSLEGGIDEQGNDYDGIDNPQESVDKDYDKIDESYGEGGYEG